MARFAFRVRLETKRRDARYSEQSLAAFATDWPRARVDCPFAYGYAVALGAVAKW